MQDVESISAFIVRLQTCMPHGSAIGSTSAGTMTAGSWGDVHQQNTTQEKVLAQAYNHREKLYAMLIELCADTKVVAKESSVSRDPCK